LKPHEVPVRTAPSLLRADHRHLRTLFLRYQRSDPGDVEGRSELFKQLKAELTVHTRIEEEIFYAALRSIPADPVQVLVREAEEEHRIAKTLLEELVHLGVFEAAFDAKMEALKERILKHTKAEESELFPLFSELGRDRRKDISERLAARKKELAPELA